MVPQGEHFGRHAQGDEVVLRLLTTGTTGLPAAPDACPRFSVYGPDGLVAADLYWEPERPGPTAGVYLARLFLGASYPAGEYAVRSTWAVGGATRHQVGAFSVAAGGDPTGRPVAMTFFRSPPNDFVVQQRQGGRVYKGKNPRS